MNRSFRCCLIHQAALSSCTISQHQWSLCGSFTWKGGAELKQDLNPLPSDQRLQKKMSTMWALLTGSSWIPQISVYLSWQKICSVQQFLVSTDDAELQITVPSAWGFPPQLWDAHTDTHPQSSVCFIASTDTENKQRAPEFFPHAFIAFWRMDSHPQTPQQTSFWLHDL